MPKAKSESTQRKPKETIAKTLAAAPHKVPDMTLLNQDGEEINTTVSGIDRAPDDTRFFRRARISKKIV